LQPHRPTTLPKITYAEQPFFAFECLSVPCLEAEQVPVCISGPHGSPMPDPHGALDFVSPSKCFTLALLSCARGFKQEGPTNPHLQAGALRRLCCAATTLLLSSRTHFFSLGIEPWHRDFDVGSIAMLGWDGSTLVHCLHRSLLAHKNPPSPRYRPSLNPQDLTPDADSAGRSRAWWKSGSLTPSLSRNLPSSRPSCHQTQIPIPPT